MASLVQPVSDGFYLWHCFLACSLTSSCSRLCFSFLPLTPQLFTSTICLSDETFEMLFERYHSLRQSFASNATVEMPSKMLDKSPKWDLSFLSSHCCLYSGQSLTWLFHCPHGFQCCLTHWMLWRGVNWEVKEVGYWFHSKPDVHLCEEHRKGLTVSHWLQG